MTLLWLLVWLCYNTPALHQWNNWLIALIVCVICDLTAGGSRV